MTYCTNLTLAGCSMCTSFRVPAIYPAWATKLDSISVGGQEIPLSSISAVFDTGNAGLSVAQDTLEDIHKVSHLAESRCKCLNSHE